MPRQLSTTFCPWVQGSHQQNPLSKSSSRESPNLRGSGPSPVWKLSLWEHREMDGWHGISGGWEPKNNFVSENQQNQDAVRKNKGISVKSQDLSSPSFQHGPISPPDLAFSVPVFLCYIGGIWVWRTCLFLLFGNWIGGISITIQSNISIWDFLPTKDLLSIVHDSDGLMWAQIMAKRKENQDDWLSASRTSGSILTFPFMHHLQVVPWLPCVPLPFSPISASRLGVSGTISMLSSPLSSALSSHFPQEETVWLCQSDPHTLLFSWGSQHGERGEKSALISRPLEKIPLPPHVPLLITSLK